MHRRNFILLILSLALSGCAVIKATQQPEKKNLAVVTEGSSRSRVIAELGPPLFSDEHDGAITDVFSFQQGYTKGVKAGRALVHGAADFATFGLWEVVGIPAETIADGTPVKLEVTYDSNRVVQNVTVFQGDKAFQAKSWLPFARRTPPAVSPTDSPTVTR